MSPVSLTDGELSLRHTAPGAGLTAEPANGVFTFAVTHRGHSVGEVAVRDVGERRGDLTWTIDAEHRRRGYATRAVRLLVVYAFAELDYLRLEAHVPREDVASARIASRAGLRREGIQRHHDRDVVVFARLRKDPDPHEPTGFRALLNSALPRKRAIAQLAIRDTQGRMLLCQLTYKHDWDLPGGVVEDDESPHDAAERECREELGLEIPAGALLLVDWLPAWGGWDDACVFVFDGGTHEPSLVDTITPEPREIRTAEFCDLEQIGARSADFTARRATVLVRDLEQGGNRLRYLESGR